MAKCVNYWEYDPDELVACPNCGWSGQARGQEEHYRELLDVTCAKCDRMLLVVSYPTSEETRAAAAAGNRHAKAELPSIEKREAWLERATGFELREVQQLPELDVPEVRIDWDFEERDGERWIVLRHAGVEMWRELAYYEGYTRFGKVFAILRERYGCRLREVRPTAESELYLYGDCLSASATVRALNATLSESSSPASTNPTALTAASDTDIIDALKILVFNGISPGTFVILEGDKARNYYIQFAFQDDQIFCEAVSNQYLKPSDQLTAEQLRRLESLGWRAPEHERQNLFRTFRPSGDADYTDIMSLARQAFVEVYHLARETPLLMRTSWEEQPSNKAIASAHRDNRSGMEPDGVIHPDGSKTDKELFEPMLGDDTMPWDVDYAKTPPPVPAENDDEFNAKRPEHDRRR